MTKDQNQLELIKNNSSFKDLFFFTKDISDLKISPSSVEHAYLLILLDDLDSALKIFASIDSPRAKWGYILVKIIKDSVIEIFPTFFQIRNFLEIDIDFLLKNKKINYIEQLLGALEFFSGINQETYKFTGRVMFENNLYSASLKYLQESKKIYYNDPELHFLLSKYYIKMNNMEEAYFYINECLGLLPSYYPALLLKEQIETYSCYNTQT